MFPKALRAFLYASLIVAGPALSPAPANGQSPNAHKPKLDKTLTDLVRTGEPQQPQRVIIRLEAGGGPGLAAKLHDDGHQVMHVHALINAVTA